MKRKQLAIIVALILLGCAGWLDGRLFARTAGVVAFACSLLIALTMGSERSPALIRLDWFVRVLRRQGTTNALRRFSASFLPRQLFSDRATKQRGIVRRVLRWGGISWLASPIRRLVQAVCLTSFLLLFIVVCWPYTAQPAPPPQLTANWQLAEIDDEGIVQLARSSQEADAWIDIGAVIYLLTDTAGPVDGRQPASRWKVRETGDSTVRLEPSQQVPDEVFERLLTHDGGWTLADRNPDAWPTHYADHLQSKEWAPAETFLLLDPLVSISTGIASRSWVWSLSGAGVILLVCVLIPRGFCGYLCPLGTTIDLFDWAVAGRVSRFRVPGDGWWVHIKYYLLAGTLMCAVMGVLVSGMFAAIPVITRAALFLLDPLQSGTLRGWHLVPSLNVGQFISIGMFLGILCLGFLRPRFWCKYVCPSGAVFSLGNLFRLTERKVESSCIHCNKCVEICPFDAIKLDFTTRTTDCTLCQSCAGVCPTEAIKFVERWNIEDLKPANTPETHETAIGRRGFLSLAAGSAAAVAGGTTAAIGIKSWGADHSAVTLVRPPGSVPEPEFLEMCIRCGECFKACPNNVLQAEGFQQGLEGLWAPMVVADWAGCESSCNACGQVCPTGAIRALPMEEKRVARMGLAIVNEKTCLPFAGKEECDLCVRECDAAGYHAIEFQQVGTQADENGAPIEGTGFLAPVVLADACVGCGLCQTRCYAINVKERHVLDESAIVIEAGAGREDRLLEGSYLELQAKRSATLSNASSKRGEGTGESSQGPRPTPFDVPGETPSENPFETPPTEPENPFGLPAASPASTEQPAADTESPNDNPFVD